MPKIVPNGFSCHNDNTKNTSNGVSRMNGFHDKASHIVHSPKVFVADSFTINTPAKDVLGSNNGYFTKTQHKMHHTIESHDSGGYGTNGNGISTATPAAKLQPLSSCYDRYPKPGSYGSLQVYPMNGINSEINNAKERERKRNESSPMTRNSDELTPNEQDRLDEILRMCADFERQNQNVQSSPIVQNRIKTNGSLPRDKKPPLSPSDHALYPSSPLIDSRKSMVITQTPGIQANGNGHHSAYENVRIISAPLYRADDARHTNAMHLSNGHAMNGYENCSPVKRSPVGYVPQSPRTRIKTCISPKREISSAPLHHQRKAEYEMLVQSFEDKLRMEIQSLREIRNGESDQSNRLDYQRNNRMPQTKTAQPPKVHGTPNGNMADRVSGHLSNHSVSMSDNIYGSLTPKSRAMRSCGDDKPIMRKNLDEKQVAQLKKQHVEVLRKTRELKSQISELQRQEEEVLRELDLEKALVTAELTTEQEHLREIEQSMQVLQAKIHRLEAQRNANRVLQETQQNKLKQSIEMKQNQVEGLRRLLAENQSDDALKDDLTQTADALENDTKTFEDLEFQYLEEETEWAAYREELHNEQKLLMRRINEKRKHIQSLEAQSIENQNVACSDTKNIEKDLLSMSKELEKYREQLKTIDTLLYELSGDPNGASESDDDVPIPRTHNDIMSQSLFGSAEVFGNQHRPSTDIMSKSVNENLFSSKIETLSFNGHSPQETNGHSSPASSSSANYENCGDGGASSNGEPATNGNETDSSTTNGQSNEKESDALQKLKYTLSPPFEHKDIDVAANENGKPANLNLSIESDDFEVNPLEKRVPSQDDIDRICKVAADHKISTQGASYKVVESIREIERNRQLLLAQQGSHVIEHERQKMSELKKKSHDEARAQYLQLQNNCDDRYRNKTGSLEDLSKVNDKHIVSNGHHTISCTNNYSMGRNEGVINNVRHSHPEFEHERPLSEVNSEMSYDALSDKNYKSSNDVRFSSGRIHTDYDGSSHRGSIMSSENSESGRMVSGTKRNLPKHQRPLTRYLPIMSVDLDLRLHIESAGHQVTLCPHVTIDSFTCRGYLHKLGATFHAWSKRWFVLDRQKMAFIYYPDKSEKKPRGGAYFSTIDEVYLDHLNTSKSGRPHCTFIVKTKRRSYHLQAASDAAARIWIDVIITGAQGNIEY